jgi:hypothetical protein
LSRGAVGGSQSAHLEYAGDVAADRTAGSGCASGAEFHPAAHDFGLPRLQRWNPRRLVADGRFLMALSVTQFRKPHRFYSSLWDLGYDASVSPLVESSAGDVGQQMNGVKRSGFSAVGQGYANGRNGRVGSSHDDDRNRGCPRSCLDAGQRASKGVHRERPLSSVPGGCGEQEREQKQCSSACQHNRESSTYPAPGQSAERITA